MVATPGSSGSDSSARAPTCRDKMVMAHDKFWPEVDKVEPILMDLEDKWNELSQSHLTVMGLFMRMRESRDFSEDEANLMLDRMAEFRKDIVDLDPAGTFEWRTNPETGTGARILPITDVAHAMHEEHRDFFALRATSMEGIPTCETCVSDLDFDTKLNMFWKSRNRSDSFFHNQLHINLRDFAAEVRKQVLEDEVNSASKTMSDSESHDWKGYIVDDAGQADQPTSLYSMGAVIRKGITGLKDGHKSLAKFSTHVEGIDHTTAKKSRRSTKNLEATMAFEETGSTTKQSSMQSNEGQTSISFSRPRQQSWRKH